LPFEARVIASRMQPDAAGDSRTELDAAGRSRMEPDAAGRTWTGHALTNQKQGNN